MIKWHINQVQGKTNMFDNNHTLSQEQHKIILMETGSIKFLSHKIYVLLQKYIKKTNKLRVAPGDHLPTSSQYTYLCDWSTVAETISGFLLLSLSTMIFA